MTTTTEHDEPEAMMCEWTVDRGGAVTTSCGHEGYDNGWTHCPGCGLRVREIEGEGVEGSDAQA